MENSEPIPSTESDNPERADNRLALWASSLYLINLLLLPGLAYLLLGWLYWHNRERDDRPLGNIHLREAFTASTVGGSLIFATLLIFWVGGIDVSSSWVYAIIYFTIIHSTFILLGVLALARAFAAEPFYYPLIGKHRARLFD